MQERECTECYGEGCIELIGDCSMPASMCCGGCVKLYKCETCNGTGYEEYEEESEEEE